jgi:hypothetical protein
MLNRNKVLLMVTSFILLVCCVLNFQSKRIASSIVEAQTNSSGLSLELSSSQKTFLRAEPITFNLKLFNQTDQPVTLRGSVSNLGNMNFLITNSEGIKSNSPGIPSSLDGAPYLIGSYASSLRTMQPGEKNEQSSLLERDLAEKLFPNPGKYDLQIEFGYTTNVPGEVVRILSNSISIDILEPEGINRQAYQFIKEKLNTARRSSNNRVVTEVTQEFVDKYRNSVYAKYIIMDLASVYQAMGDDKKALRELCKISGEKFHHSKQVERIVLEINEKLNPIDWDKIPDGAPEVVIKHPCTGKILN